MITMIYFDHNCQLICPLLFLFQSTGTWPALRNDRTSVLDIRLFRVIKLNIPNQNVNVSLLWPPLP